MALVPLLAVLARPPVGARRRLPLSRAFQLGLVSGLVYFAGTLYWTASVMAVYGGLDRFVAVPVALALVAYLALYPALFAVVLARLLSRAGARALAAAPLVWVAAEYARGYLFTGFPWVLLGYTQATVLPVAQLASVVGVFGLSGFVAAVNAALAWAVIAPRLRQRVVAATIAAVAVGVVAGWGGSRLGRNTLAGAGPRLRVAIVQGNVPQDEKWDPAHASAIVARYLRMSREAASEGARFIIWPESSTPFYFEEDPVGRAAIARLAVDTGTHVLVGSDQVERGTPSRYYNAAFLVGPDGQTAAVYRKMHLVPFGEYVPLQRLLFFVAPLVEAVASFSPGTEAVILPIGEARASTAICYEVVYPDLVRRFVLGGSELLTTITNDAWYGQSSAPHQHFEQAVVRAIEQGRYLVRSANTGISAIVDPYGRILRRSTLFQTETLVGDVGLLSGRTIYGRTGDLVAWAAIGFTALALAATWRRSRTP